MLLIFESVNRSINFELGELGGGEAKMLLSGFPPLYVKDVIKVLLPGIIQTFI